VFYECCSVLRVLQVRAECFGVSQCVAVCYVCCSVLRVLQCVACVAVCCVCCSVLRVLQFDAESHSVSVCSRVLRELQCRAGCCSVSQRCMYAVWCYVFQFRVVYCSVSKMTTSRLPSTIQRMWEVVLQCVACVAGSCRVLQCVIEYWGVYMCCRLVQSVALWHSVAGWCSVLQCRAVCCSVSHTTASRVPPQAKGW